jgi:Ca2+-transporting ATPase
LTKENIWHTLSVEEIFKNLKTSVRGLTTAEAEKRLKEYGPNELEEERRFRKLALLFDQVKSPLIGVLFVAAFISFLVGKLVDAIVVAVVIALNTAVGFFQGYKAEAALQALKSLAAPEAEVIRDCPEKGTCIEMRVKAREIVPGDIILLDAGDKVPADARIFEAINLEIDESMLTGESTPVRKTIEPLDKDLPVADRKNMAFSGTIVTQGRGKAVVVATGMKTEIGKIAKLIKETEKAETPFQKRTSDLSKKLGLFALIAGSLILMVSLIRGFEFYQTFLFALAAIVSAIPEGLPAVMTITLAVGVNRMAKRNAIIRKLQAVDTLGSATVIVTDKTGTLTTNQLTVQKIFVNGKMVKVTGVGFAPEGSFEINGVPIDPKKKDDTLSLLLEIAALCNDARLRQHKTDGYRWEIYGDPTEGALVVASEKAGFNKEELEAQLPRVDEIPFDAKERYMATFHKSPEENLRVYVKGAPETILEMCSDILIDGKIKKLSPKEREELLKVSTEMASEALRVLAMAYKIIEPDNLEVFKENIRQKRAKLVFVGIIGMIDPPRPEAKQSVQLCKRAGIKVIMATGDHKLTAEAIAREIGILEPGSKILTGAELDNMNDDDLDAVIEQTSVFARVSPSHKYRIVESLRRRGHIVAMTGDGVNDAPALKAAEIGVAMGITGTDVTKETADMVLTDDNFASIVSAVEEGRVVFENIRKVVKYLIATNTGEIITILTALIFFPHLPLIFTPVQILWVNLVTDGLLVTPLAMEPKEEDVMDQPPRKPNEKIINRDIMLNTIYVGIFMMIGTLYVFMKEWNGGGLIRAQTLGFTTMAMFQVFNALNCRSRTKSVFKIGFFTNKYLFGAIAASVTLQVLATLLPPLKVALGTTSISAWDWLTIILISSSVFFADELRKLVRKKVKG